MKPKKVLGVLAGRDLAPGALETWLAWADLVVAADGGADLCREAGREPDVIVGDLDSISDPTGLTPDTDQDSSDADKLLACLRQRGIPNATLIGVEGDRLDHVLATLFSVVRSGLHCRLVLRMGMAHVIRAPSESSWEAEGRLSLLPLEPCRATLLGVRWPLNQGSLSPFGLVSLSNESLGSTIFLALHEGTAVLFMNSGRPPTPANEPQ